MKVVQSGILPGLTRAEIKAKKEEALEDKEKKLVSNHLWANLLARTFEVDVSKCRHCKGPLKIISAIRDPVTVAKILSHLGLSPQPPPIAASRIREIFTITS